MSPAGWLLPPLLAAARGMAPGQTVDAWVLRVLDWIEAIGARQPGGELP